MDDANKVFQLLGELRADMKHVLRGQERTKEEYAALEARLDKVERFNVKVLTYASIATPVLVTALSAGTQWFMGS